MTDEMRVALTALATARGLTPAEAWDLVERLPVDGRPLRQVVDDLDRLAVQAIDPDGEFGRV